MKIITFEFKTEVDDPKEQKLINELVPFIVQNALTNWQIDLILSKINKSEKPEPFKPVFPKGKKAAEFWGIVKMIDWGNTNNGRFADWKIGKEFLERKYTRKEIGDFRTIGGKFQSALMKTLDEYSKQKQGDLCYYGTSDDGFNDLTAHIVGLGKDVYFGVIEEPELALIRAKNHDYKENFFYCFQD